MALAAGGTRLNRHFNRFAAEFFNLLGYCPPANRGDPPNSCAHFLHYTMRSMRLLSLQ